MDGEVHEAQVVGPSTGVYLEPVPVGAATDTSAVRQDTISIPPDTLGVRADTTGVRADTTRASREENEPG